MDRNMDWKTIEAEALAQVRAELAKADTTPLPYGHSVAWVECRFGRTDDLSLAHRVQSWSVDEARTLCGELIPPAIRRLSLSAGVVRSLGRCRYCDEAYAEQANAA